VNFAVNVVHIDDASDVRLAHYTRLTDMQLRMVSEPARGIFLAEGEKVITRALDAGLDMISALMEPKWWPALEPRVPPDAIVYLAPLELLTGITGFRLHRGALAAFRRPVPRPVDEVLHRASTAVLMEDLVDHTNVGAVFRSAAGLGVDAVLVTSRCADPWYRRSVKTSMGAVFSTPWTVVEDASEGIAAARRYGMTTVALDTQGEQSLRRWRPQGANLLLLGSEGPGLSDAARAATDVRVSIPMAHGVDSLNVAMAATVACYVLTS
jgi:tRNA G18 (ribose-2'-O)-methylase SpoU